MSLFLDKQLNEWLVCLPHMYCYIYCRQVISEVFLGQTSTYIEFWQLVFYCDQSKGTCHLLHVASYAMYIICCMMFKIERESLCASGWFALKSSPCATLCRPRCAHGFLINIERTWHIIDSQQGPWISVIHDVFVEMISFAPFDTSRAMYRIQIAV